MLTKAIFILILEESDLENEEMEEIRDDDDQDEWLNIECYLLGKVKMAGRWTTKRKRNKERDRDEKQREAKKLVEEERK